MSETETPSQTIPLSEAERRKLLLEWNATEMELPKACCLHEVIEERASQSPDAIAVICRNEQLTYSELSARANRVASHLRKLGVKPETLVGISVERSLEMIIGLLGILKSGAAYVPLDPTYPKERLAFMLEDSKPLVLLTQTTLLDLLPKTDSHIVCVDTFDWAVDVSGSEESIQPSAASSHQSPLAYVIYTSGSTGKPKGVMVEHANVLNFFVAMNACVPSGGTATDPGGTWLAVTSPSFDISVLELFWTLSRGFKVVVYAGEETKPVAARPELPPTDADFSIAALILRHGVTHLQCTPSMASMLLLDEKTRSALGRLQTVLIGGEPFSVKLVRELRAVFKGTLLNMYGPTETTVWSTTSQLPPDEVPIRVPVGRPIANTQIYILDPNLQLVPIGAEGELFIGGAGVARGYLRRDQLTAERFIPNSFVEQPSARDTRQPARIYRTGDRARYLGDGNIELLGRVDHQVKIRGHRVELGEIETIINEHPNVRESVVLFRDLPNLEKILVAYIIPREGQKLTREELRQYARERLPEYMVPTQVVFMTVFPQTPNKKIDRNAFPIPKSEVHEAEANSHQAATPVEEALAALWKEILRLPRIGRNDNFFDLGGHSMLAMQLVTKVRKQFKVDFPLKNVFEHQTLGGMAEIIQAMSWSDFAKAPRSGKREVVEL